MIRHLSCCALLVAAFSATVVAGDHFYFRSYSTPPVMYPAPVVAYQPAYVVPTPFVSVQAYPVATVTYSTQYYAPLVPVASYAVVPAPYPVPVHYGGFRPYRHGVSRIEYERDGDIRMRQRYR
jgi:hypothetical protein